MTRLEKWSHLCYDKGVKRKKSTRNMVYWSCFLFFIKRIDSSLRVEFRIISRRDVQDEFFGLLGHNGTGKTTTIEMMLGLKTIDHGYVSLLGMNPRKERRAYEKVGVQLQSSHYKQHMKVYEVCEERATLYKNPQDYKTLLKNFILCLVLICMLKIYRVVKNKNYPLYWH